MTSVKTIIINGYEIKVDTSEERTENYESCKEWLKNNLILKKSINTGFSSYWIKYIVEEDLGIKVSNYDVKAAMCELDIEGVAGYPDVINYYYPISQKFFKKYNTRKL